ncbi:MAG TPA: LCP family protein [Microthrixaceae bacterium]|nr:LCP family protein [Microthrixaceae bacterium]
MGPPDGGRKARRTGPQRLLLSLNIVLVIACLGAAGGLTFVRVKLADVQVVSLGVSLAPKVDVNEPRNILIIGTDSADRLDEDDPARSGRPEGGLLADVIMVLRLDPKENKASLLSIPRDTYVPIGGTDSENKINSAIFGANGADRLIQTIKQNFGISIDNYVQLDFQGFRELIEVLDGVPMYVTMPVRDRNTGLLIKETGCVVLDPAQALAYARARHLEYQDPDTKKWTSDPTADLGRINRQQAFIQRAAHRAVSRGARNPATAFQLVNAAVRAITIDETMTVDQILEVIDRFRNLNVDSLVKYQLPTFNGGDASFSYQEVNWDDAEPVLDPFRGTVPGQEPAVSDVQVSVAPSAAELGDAVVVAEGLEARGFDADLDTKARKNPVSKATTRTTIAYGPRGREAAVVLARHLDAYPTFVLEPKLPGARLRLVAGKDLTAVREDPLPADAMTLPPPRTTTTKATVPTTTAKPGAPTTTAPPTTAPTTTILGVNPTDDAAAKRCG